MTAVLLCPWVPVWKGSDVWQMHPLAWLSVPSRFGVGCIISFQIIENGFFNLICNRIPNKRLGRESILRIGQTLFHKRSGSCISISFGLWVAVPSVWTKYSKIVYAARYWRHRGSHSYDATVHVFLSALCLSSRKTRQDQITECSQIWIFGGGFEK